MQDRNAELVQNLTQDFARRNEFNESGARLADAMMWMNREGGGALMWAFDGQSVACYGGGSASQWAPNGGIDYSNYAATPRGGPYITLDGAGEYLSIPNAPWQESLTSNFLVWTWCCPSDLSNSRTIVAKYVWATNNRSWYLRYDLTLSAFVWLSNQTGLAGGNVIIASTYAPVLADTWYFVGGYFEASTQMKICVASCTDARLTTTTLTAAIPAGLYDSIAPLTIGADGNPSTYFIGRAGAGLARANVPASHIEGCMSRLFQATRWFYQE